MELPFIYGKIAENDNFTDRVTETAHLVQNLYGLVNTIIISPRRWGKTSLVNKVLTEIGRDKNCLIAHIDIFNCRNEEQFYKTFSNAVLCAATEKFDEFVNFVKKYLSAFSPKVSLSDSAQSYELSLGVDFKDPDLTMDEILDLPQVIATDKKKKFIICIDEFQNIGNYENNIDFQRKLRAHWQRHTSVGYCLYGSKRHLLMDIFGNYEMPFYKFGDILFLEKIPENDWVNFIRETFQRTNKEITSEQALMLVNRVEAHPYYVQQLAQQVWLRTERTCSNQIVEQAHESIINQLNLMFNNILDTLTVKQINYLYAVVDGVVNFSSKDVLKKYDLGTSANIKNLRNALLGKDLIDVLPNGRIVLQDPLFACWLKGLKRW